MSLSQANESHTGHLRSASSAFSTQPLQTDITRVITHHSCSCGHHRSLHSYINYGVVCGRFANVYDQFAVVLKSDCPSLASTIGDVANALKSDRQRQYPPTKMMKTCFDGTWIRNHLRAAEQAERNRSIHEEPKNNNSNNYSTVPDQIAHWRMLFSPIKASLVQLQSSMFVWRVFLLSSVTSPSRTLEPSHFRVMAARCLAAENVLQKLFRFSGRFTGSPKVIRRLTWTQIRLLPGLSPFCSPWKCNDFEPSLHLNHRAISQERSPSRNPNYKIPDELWVILLLGKLT